MKVEIDDIEFGKIAMELNIDPGLLVKKITDHFKRFPRYAINEIINYYSSLDEMLDFMIENSEAGYTFNHLIKRTMGNYKYIISDSGYDLADGVIWIDMDIFKQKNIEQSITSAHLQYGNYPLIIVEGFANLTKLATLVKLEEDISDKIDFFPVVSEAKDSTFYLEESEESILYSLQLDSDEALNIPKLIEIDEVMSYVREIILSHNIMKNQKV